MASSVETAIELETIKHLPDATAVPLVTSNVSEQTSVAPQTRSISTTRANIIVIQVAGTELLSSFSNGTLTVGLPTIAASLGLQSDLLLWPSSAYYLTCGTLLLVAGTIADVVGPRKVNLTGCLMLSAFILASGLARNAIQLIMFRAMAGIAYSMTSPSSVSIITASTEAGTRRNISFACLGVAKLIGFSAGLVLGGVFVDTIGWRSSYYIGGALGFVLFIVGLWALPLDPRGSEQIPMRTRLRSEIDWVGAGIASTALATMSYVLSVLAADADNIKAASNIVVLTVSILASVGFAAWMQWQEAHGRPALVPNSLWKKASFSTICIMTMLASANCDGMELFCSLYFQDVQGNTALGASLRILPSLVVGAILNFTTGVMVNRIPVTYAVLITSVLCAGAPLLMATIQPVWPYWCDAFFAQLLAPLSTDVLFTVGLLVVSETFPARTQALAGAVFNTFAQLGISIGLTVMSLVSTAVTKGSQYPDKTSPEALMAGYRATFWTMFAWMVTACLLGGLGLRGMGKVGMKRD